jgi:hypothetical protein
MSLKDLSDKEFKEFVRHPHVFLHDSKNFHKVFDLDDGETLNRIEKVRKELHAELAAAGKK